MIIDYTWDNVFNETTSMNGWVKSARLLIMILSLPWVMAVICFMDVGPTIIRGGRSSRSTRFRVPFALGLLHEAIRVNLESLLTLVYLAIYNMFSPNGRKAALEQVGENLLREWMTPLYG
jgi:hypothetical protein